MNPHLALLFSLLSISISASSATPTPLSTSPSDTLSRFQQYLRIDTSQPNPDYPAAISFLLSQSLDLPLLPKTLEFVPGKPLLLLRWPGLHPSLSSLLLYSHTDVVPAEPLKWSSPPFSAHLDPSSGRIYARGSQDMKSIGMQHLEAVRRLHRDGFQPQRTLYVVLAPDEEIGGRDGAKKLVESEEFQGMNIGVVVDEGLPSEQEEYRVFYGERSPWWMSITARGAPGHGAKLYDGSAMENLMKSVEVIRRFRASQYDMVKAGLKEEGEVVSVNMVYLKAGTPSGPSPTGFVMNLQPSEAEAGFDVRVPPHANAEALEKRIAEEWAPSSRNMTFELGQYKQKVPVYDKFGKPAVTRADSSNPWWLLLDSAVQKAGGKLSKPEIFPASTDARYFREIGLPAFGFSPIANTPSLLHDHNEYLHKDEYLKGIEMYISIIRELTSFTGDATTKDNKDEL